jgi:hypothetical protein
MTQRPWKALPYRLSSEVKEYLIDMHFFGEIDYEHLIYDGEYEDGLPRRNFDVGLDIGYFDWREIPNLEKDLEQISKDVKIQRVSVCKMNPNVSVPFHIDTQKAAAAAPALRGMNRKCSILFPIMPEPENYITTCFEQGPSPYHECMLINTSVNHGLQNNGYFRINLQLWIGQSFEEVADLLN